MFYNIFNNYDCSHQLELEGEVCGCLLQGVDHELCGGGEVVQHQHTGYHPAGNLPAGLPTPTLKHLELVLPRANHVAALAGATKCCLPSSHRFKLVLCYAAINTYI